MYSHLSNWRKSLLIYGAITSIAHGAELPMKVLLRGGSEFLVEVVFSYIYLLFINYFVSDMDDLRGNCPGDNREAHED